METKILKPFKDGHEIWLGLDTPGLRRKVFRLVDDKLTGSEHVVAGLTIFDPGERSAYHSHSASEEVDIIIKGKCKAIWGTENEEQGSGEMESHDFMTIGKGVFHKHINIGDEPLWLVWLYTPPGDLPTE
jgi:oxalate decarboxylase/phosphoglucose isomerase-like protein (cupin superfamily)